MIGRIGFRRLLPILFALTHAALLFFTSAGQPVTPSDVDSTSYPPLSDMPPAPMTVAQKAALVLNFPALILSVPVVLAFSRSSNMGSLYASLPFVALVWYGVGRWADRLMGLVPQPGQLRRIWRLVFAIVSAILVCLGIAAITPINHHRSADAYWFPVALTLWSGLFLVISTSGFVRKSV
jgi:hypothetical protein